MYIHINFSHVLKMFMGGGVELYYKTWQTRKYVASLFDKIVKISKYLLIKIREELLKNPHVSIFLRYNGNTELLMEQNL